MMPRRVKPYAPSETPPILCPELLPVAERHRNPWFHVCERGTYYTIEYDAPQVSVMPVVGGNHVVMVRVNRPLMGDTPLEFPAGGSEPGETPVDAARRELAEETGIAVADLTRFASMLPLSEMPCRMPLLHSVFRIDLTKEEFDRRGATDPEIAAVELLPRTALIDMILHGDIYISSTIATLARFLLSDGKGHA